MNKLFNKLGSRNNRRSRPVFAALFFYLTAACGADDLDVGIENLPGPDESAPALPASAIPAAVPVPQLKQYFQWLDPKAEISVITGVLKTPEHPYLTVKNFSPQQADLDKLYQLSKGQLLWVQNSTLTEPALEAMKLLADAGSSALNPFDYDLANLQGKQLKAGQQTSAEQAALFDSALSIALLRYCADLHSGRIKPEKLQIDFKAKEPQPNFAQLLFDAARQGSVSQIAAKLEPDIPLYQNLKHLLPHYRELANGNAGQHFEFGKKLLPRASHEQIPQLRDYLVKAGDYPVEKTAAIDSKSNLYDDALVAAMKKFQRRSGLPADGIIGPATAAKLNGTANSALARQNAQKIELTMERLRWLPKLKDSPFIFVNIPSFRLWAFETPDFDWKQALTMKVVVGEAKDKQTPVFMADMSYLDFKPYWNVPYSILKNEILPKLGRDPGFLSRQNMEVVTRFGNDVKAVGLKGGSYSLLKSGALQVRQRPGRRNALGSVKFVFPNVHGVYMHDTPSQRFFAQSRRDFSHGCVRVAEPGNLAEFALKPQTEWTPEKIRKAMSGADKPRRVMLKNTIPVIIFYATAITDDKGGVQFLDDIYGHDNKLSIALLKKAPPPKLPGQNADPQIAVNN